jgi:transglutaminase-like putative cysteine protease
MAETQMITQIDDAYLKPGVFIDSDHSSVRAFALRVAGDVADPRSAAVKLYNAVRDDILYDPYMPYGNPETYRASSVLAAKRGYCVGKAALLAAVARARGIAARVAFADVRNHLATPRLLALMGRSDFIFHGIAELWLDERWVKATPTFNLTLCEKFKIHPLDFDGRSDATLHPFDRDGSKHMEYVRERGAYADVPVDIIMPAMLSTYPRLAELTKGRRGDFAREAERTVRSD